MECSRFSTSTMRCFNSPWSNENHLNFIHIHGIAFCEFKEGVDFISALFPKAFPEEQIIAGRVIGVKGRKFSNRNWRSALKNRLSQRNLLLDVQYIKGQSTIMVSQFIAFRYLFSEITIHDLVLEEERKNYHFFLNNIDIYKLDFQLSVRYKMVILYLVV
jgi:hypothetical protein